MNPRITPRERGLLKGSIRRVFARSDLRRAVLEAAAVDHSDPAHPRVKKWSRCAVCKKPYPRYKTVVDHRVPVIALDSSFEEQGLDKTVDRTWCDPTNLDAICEPCHKAKSKGESDVRKQNKRSKKR